MEIVSLSHFDNNDNNKEMRKKDKVITNIFIPIPSIVHAWMLTHFHPSYLLPFTHTLLYIHTPSLSLSLSLHIHSHFVSMYLSLSLSLTNNHTTMHTHSLTHTQFISLFRKLIHKKSFSFSFSLSFAHSFLHYLSFSLTHYLSLAHTSPHPTLDASEKRGLRPNPGCTVLR